MRHCPKCGAYQGSEGLYCEHCGAYIGLSSSSSSSSYSEEKTNGMAIAGFVCSFFIPILGIIFSGIGLSKAATLDGKGKGLATAGLVISIMMIVWNVISSILWWNVFWEWYYRLLKSSVVVFE